MLGIVVGSHRPSVGIELVCIRSQSPALTLYCENNLIGFVRPNERHTKLRFRKYCSIRKKTSYIFCLYNLWFVFLPHSLTHYSVYDYPAVNTSNSMTSGQWKFIIWQSSECNGTLCLFTFASQSHANHNSHYAQK